MVWILAVISIVLFLNTIKSQGKKQIEHRIQALYSVRDPQFARCMGSLLGPSLVPGNKTVELLNGDCTFPAMLNAIRNAKKTITFETYIYWSGEIGKEFSDALSERAKAGLNVHLLLDWVGSGKMDAELLKEMKDSGVEVERYHPLKWFNLGRFNNRTHRKILVVDGKIAFTGGLGVADHWLGHAQSTKNWRDTHFQLEGPAVAQMQAAFMDNWIESRSQVLHGEDYFPALEQAGNEIAQVFKSSPDEGAESVRLMYLLSIAAARETIRIANAYFIPDDLCIQALVAAAERGVKIQIIVPGKVLDNKITRRASRIQWGKLLNSGIEIYEYQPTMFHCKIVIVDDVWVSVGSTNFDNRSFRLNDETNLNVLDEKFAKGQIQTFNADLANSKRVTFQEWSNRPVAVKLRDHLSGLLRRQL